MATDTKFLSYEGLSHLVSKLWAKIDDIFLRKIDASVLDHLEYFSDSSTLKVDASILVDSITVGDDHFDGVEDEIIDSENPIKAKALYRYKAELEERLNNIDEQLKEIWAIIQADPVRWKEDVLIIDTLHELFKEVCVIEETLTAIDKATGDDKGLPEDVFVMDATDPETMNIVKKW